LQIYLITLFILISTKSNTKDKIVSFWGQNKNVYYCVAILQDPEIEHGYSIFMILFF